MSIRCLAWPKPRRTLHRQVPSAKLHQTPEAALWLALATGYRIGELHCAEWQHVRLDTREWFISSANSKNDKPHTIHFSSFSLGHFVALQAINGASQWCFPNRDDSASRLSPSSLAIANAATPP